MGVKFLGNLVNAVGERWIVAFGLFCPAKNRLPLGEKLPFAFVPLQRLKVAERQSPTICSVKAEFISVEASVAARKGAAMVLRLQTREEQAFQSAKWTGERISPTVLCLPVSSPMKSSLRAVGTAR